MSLLIGSNENNGRANFFLHTPIKFSAPAESKHIQFIQVSGAHGNDLPLAV